MRFRCGCGYLIFFVFISSLFAIFKNFVHSLEPGVTPSYSASHQALNYVQRSEITQNTLKRCVAVAVRLRLFFNLLKTSTVNADERLSYATFPDGPKIDCDICILSN